jgi:molecular chaperone DnaJ
MTVEIPPGVYDGLVLRQRQGGEAGARGGPAGDLNLHIAVLPHEIFEREGDDIYCVVPIPMTRAALGGSVSVPTLEGETELKIPPGTQGGEQFRLKGLGIPRLHSSARGDELVRVAVETPVNLTAEQKELLLRLEESLGKRNRPSEKGFFERLRRLVGG